MATTAMRKVSSVPAIMLVLSVLACLLLVHAAAVGNRRALLPREDPADGIVVGEVLLPTTAEEAAVGGAEAHHEQVAGEEGMRRAGLLQTEDYPGSGANSRHDPRNPH